MMLNSQGGAKANIVDSGRSLARYGRLFWFWYGPAANPHSTISHE